MRLDTIKPTSFFAVLLLVVTVFLLCVVPIKAKSALGVLEFSLGVELEKSVSNSLTLLEKKLSCRLRVSAICDGPVANPTPEDGAESGRYSIAITSGRTDSDKEKATMALGEAQRYLDELYEEKPTTAKMATIALGAASGGPVKAVISEGVNQVLTYTLGDEMEHPMDTVTSYAGTALKAMGLQKKRLKKLKDFRAGTNDSEELN